MGSINNQLKAAAAPATEMATMTATTMMMETKVTVAAEVQGQRGGGGQLGGNSGRLVRVWQRRHRQRQRGGGSVAAVAAASLAAEATAWRERDMISNNE